MARAKPKDDPHKNALAFERPIWELDSEIKKVAAQLQKDGVDPAGSPKHAALVKQRDALLDELAGKLTVWQRIQISRHIDRPGTSEYVDQLCTEVIELHGDRLYGDDQAIFAGLATLKGRRLLVVGNRKGRTTDERIACNWGCAHPEGYRKALRCMQLAARQGLPVLTLINTPGAYPGVGAEERGQASAIAWNILEMYRLPVPVVSVVIGEGGSGGALGIGVCDRLLVLENAYYSVISPEGCASILWKDGSRAEEAANSLRLGSSSLLELGVADEILTEPRGGAHRDKGAMAQAVGEAVGRHFDELSALPPHELRARREQKYRSLGRVAGVGSEIPRTRASDPVPSLPIHQS